MNDREQLKKIILELSYEKRLVTLASGRQSDFYFDGKQTTLHAEGGFLVGKLFYEAIKDVAVVGKPDPEAGEIPKAFVVLKPEYKNKVTAEEIIEWCKERISGYKRIREVEFVDEIPRTASGKILRRVLRELERRRASK